MAISALPRSRGNSPANSPTQAAPNIWYGSHGPTPPVMIADANSVRAAEDDAEPGPEHPPGQDEREEHRLDPGGAGAEGPQRGADRRQDAEHRQRLGVDAALGDLGEHDGEDDDEEHAEHQRRRLRAAEGAGLRRRTAT